MTDKRETVARYLIDTKKGLSGYTVSDSSDLLKNGEFRILGIFLYEKDARLFVSAKNRLDKVFIETSDRSIKRIIGS